jgi:hypothetical protein
MIEFLFENIGNHVTLIVRDLRLYDADKSNKDLFILIKIFFLGIYEVQSGPLIIHTPYVNIIKGPQDITEVIDETVTYTITPNLPLSPVDTKI